MTAGRCNPSLLSLDAYSSPTNRSRGAGRGLTCPFAVPYARPMTASPPDPTEPRVHGEAIVYRLFDVGYAIALDRASDLLASSGPERRRPSRGEAQTIQIPNP